MIKAFQEGRLLTIQESVLMANNGIQMRATAGAIINALFLLSVNFGAGIPLNQ